MGMAKDSFRICVTDYNNNYAKEAMVPGKTF
jgi:hypothetical protein